MQKVNFLQKILIVIEVQIPTKVVCRIINCYTILQKLSAARPTKVVCKIINCYIILQKLSAARPTNIDCRIIIVIIFCRNFLQPGLRHSSLKKCPLAPKTFCRPNYFLGTWFPGSPIFCTSAWDVESKVWTKSVKNWLRFKHLKWLRLVEIWCGFLYFVRIGPGM